MAKYQYSVGNRADCHAPSCRYEFPKDQQLYGANWDLVIDELAVDYNWNCDGWEDKWPLEFRIYDEGQEVARFKVEREFEPVFLSMQISTSNEMTP